MSDDSRKQGTLRVRFQGGFAGRFRALTKALVTSAGRGTGHSRARKVSLSRALRTFRYGALGDQVSAVRPPLGSTSKREART